MLLVVAPACPGPQDVKIDKVPPLVVNEGTEGPGVFHSPGIFVPRLNRHELFQVGEEICKRLQSTSSKAVFMLPLRGVGRYSIPGGPLHDPDGDAAFFGALRAGMPTGVNVVEIDADAEDSAFIREAVRRLVEMLEDDDE